MVSKREMQYEKEEILKVKRYEELKKKEEENEYLDYTEQQELRDLEERFKGFEWSRYGFSSKVNESSYSERTKRILLAGADYLDACERARKEVYNAKKRASKSVSLDNSGSMSGTERKAVGTCLRDIKSIYEQAQRKKKAMGKKVDSSGIKVGEYQQTVAKAIEDEVRFEGSFEDCNIEIIVENVKEKLNGKVNFR